MSTPNKSSEATLLFERAKCRVYTSIDVMPSPVSELTCSTSQTLGIRTALDFRPCQYSSVTEKVGFYICSMMQEAFDFDDDISPIWCAKGVTK